SPSRAWARLRSGRGPATPASARGAAPAAPPHRWPDPEEVWRRVEAEGIDVALSSHAAYPWRLQGDPEAPAVLFCLGELPVVNARPTVALVGTRSPTRYGLGVAAQFGADLAAAGVSVVSGLALGVDAAAHEGACAARPGGGAPPVAVVAGGLDEPYPRRNARLWGRVAEAGVVISESPPGVATERWRFPVRNRLLAALSDLVVVVESRLQGGSMHTVAAALARGVPVGAVPGSIRSAASAGPNSLLADGCLPISGISDIVAALSLNGAGLSLPPAPLAPEYHGPDQDLYRLLSHDPAPVDRLVEESGLELGRLCAGLERLASAGFARDLGGWWERT
ncbi:MAG TPA: DNA-processing protein DprA, partial [Acidimicrobiales bacterium]|nr:DNA-processing protein DprA [Acidimicrobiales bacterium]